MTEPGDLPEAALRARVSSAALARGERLDLWSLALLSIALIAVLWKALPLSLTLLLLLSIAAAGLQKFYALRVAFDEALIRHWGQLWSDAAAQGDALTLLSLEMAALDRALGRLGLRSPRGDSVRDLDTRLRGALTLLKLQILCFALQVATLVGALAAWPLIAKN